MPQTHEGAQRDEVADLLAAPAGQHGPGADGVQGFVVMIRTPAGHEHRFRVDGAQRVATVTERAVAYFVAHHELAEGQYVLALIRHGQPEDLTASARLEDYGVREGDVLVLIVGEPQVDG